MVAQRIPDRIVLFENKELAASHSKRAHNLLEYCRTEADRRKLAFYSATSILEDGTVIVAKKVGAFSIAEIASPFPKKEEKKPKIEPSYPLIIIYVGNEEVGYTVGKFLLSGELFSVYRFDNAEEMFLTIPQVNSPSVYKRKISVTGADADRIQSNSNFQYDFNFCSIPSYSRCGTLPLSPTKGCVFISDDEYAFHTNLIQKSETVYALREWCLQRDSDGRGTQFLKQYNWTQVSKNIQGVGAGARVCIKADGIANDEERIWSDSIYTAAALVLDWWHCSSGWTDNGYWIINFPRAFGQASFFIDYTPIGPMVADSNYSASAYVSGFLDGSAKMREDTGEPYLELWDNDTLYSFLDEDLSRSIYAFSHPPVSNTYVISSLFSPVSFVNRPEDGLPDLTANRGLHTISTAVEYEGVRVDAYVSSFMEAEYNRIDEMYYPTEVFQRIFGRCAIGVPGFPESNARARGDKFFLSIQSFLRNIHEEHTARGLMPENVRSMRGNIGLYMADEFKKPSIEAENKIKIFNLVNNVRASFGLNKLSPDGDLDYLAEIHAYDCALNDIEGHESSYGGQVGERAGQTLYGTRAYQLLEVGENVSWGYPTPEEAVEGWMNSPAHRANILKEDWLDTGISVQISADGKPFYVQVFGLQDR